MSRRTRSADTQAARGQRTDLNVVEFERRDPPRMVGLSKLRQAARDRWREIWLSDVARYWNTASHFVAAERYIRMYDQWLRYDDLIRKYPMVQGSTGQMRANPLAKDRHALSQDMRDVETELGLTPRAHMGLGISAAAGALTEAELRRRLAQEATNVEDEWKLPDGVEVVDAVDYSVVEGKEA